MRRTLDDTPFVVPTGVAAGVAADLVGIPEDAIIRAIEDGTLDWQRIGGTTLVGLEHVERLAGNPPVADAPKPLNLPFESAPVKDLDRTEVSVKDGPKETKRALTGYHPCQGPYGFSEALDSPGPQSTALLRRDGTS